MRKSLALEQGCGCPNRGILTDIVFFSPPRMMKVPLSVRKPTLLIRPCNTIHSDALPVKSPRAAEICILAALKRGAGLRACMLMSEGTAKVLFPSADWHLCLLGLSLLSRWGRGRKPGAASSVGEIFI